MWTNENNFVWNPALLTLVNHQPASSGAFWDAFLTLLSLSTVYVFIVKSYIIIYQQHFQLSTQICCLYYMFILQYIQIYYVASLILHASIAEIDCLYHMCIWFHQTTARLSGLFCRLTSWKGAGYIVSMGRVSVTISFIPLSDNRNSQIYKWKQFYWEFSCI